MAAPWWSSGEPQAARKLAASDDFMVVWCVRYSTVCWHGHMLYDSSVSTFYEGTFQGTGDT